MTNTAPQRSTTREIEKNRWWWPRRRRAAAAVELAICMPVIMLLGFASLEGASMLFVREAAIQAAYEAAKGSAKPTGSQALGVTRAKEILSARKLQASSITFDPVNVDDLTPGTPFTVEVSIPGDSRSVTGIGPFKGLNIQAQITMLKE